MLLLAETKELNRGKKKDKIGKYVKTTSIHKSCHIMLKENDIYIKCFPHILVLTLLIFSIAKIKIKIKIKDIQRSICLCTHTCVQVSVEKKNNGSCINFSKNNLSLIKLILRKQLLLFFFATLRIELTHSNSHTPMSITS